MQLRSNPLAAAGKALGRLGRSGRRFGADRKGGVALPFAMAAIPLALMSVAAVDFHRASMVRNGLQDALDAATLAAGRTSTTDAALIQQIGQDALAANLKAYPSTELTGSSFTLQGEKVVGTASMHMTPLVAQIFGAQMNIAAESEVVRGLNKLEIAMVLDNTGSMAGTKLSTLKTAASNFVDTLSAAAARSAEPNAVKIALVPFSMTVRVGSGYRDASWIDQTGASPINDEIFSSHANRFSLFQQMNVAWGGCVESRQAPYDVQDTPPDAANPATLFTPYFAPDEPGDMPSGRWTDSWGGDTWYNNYLVDGTSSSSWSARQGNVAKYASTSLRTGSNRSTGYAYGPNAGCALQPLMRLTDDWNGLKSAIGAMTAVGDTNIPMGMMWGWHVLSPNAPFGDGVPYGTAKTKKIVVMMTDGQNTETANGNANASFYSGLGYIWQRRLGLGAGASNAQRQAALDGRLATLCANMKAQGIDIYTVRVEVNDSNFQVLQACASKPDQFFDVQSASQLTAVFDTIAQSIENLRITH